jgi:hypothetical protein
VTKKKSKPSKPKYRPCGRCINGLVRTEVAGVTVMKHCRCWLEFKHGKPVQHDGKERAANG